MMLLRSIRCGGGILLLAAMLTLSSCSQTEARATKTNDAVRFDSPYQAVLLDNGSVYFGKLENFESNAPILREVFYVQSAMDQNTKQMRTVLIRRGKELHEPDHMVLNRDHIIFVEPVAKDSKIWKLIEELKAK